VFSRAVRSQEEEKRGAVVGATVVMVLKLQTPAYFFSTTYQNCPLSDK
jgi:hypothetical protein